MDKKIILPKGLVLKSFKDEIIKESGVIPFDLCTGGGYVDGDMIEIASKPGVGKTTLVLTILKVFLENDKDKRTIFYFDSENALKEGLLIKMDLMKFIDSRLFVVTSSDFETIDKLLVQIVKPENPSNAGFIVIDSLAGITTKKILESDVGDVQVGVVSRYMGHFLTKYKVKLRESGITFFAINQLRNKLDFSWGGKTELDSSGGFAIKYNADVRVFLESGSKITKDEIGGIKDKDITIGNLGRIYSLKSKNGRPFVKHYLPVIYGKCVSNVLTLREILKKFDYLKGGSGGNFQLILKDKEKDILNEKIKGSDNVDELIKNNYKKIYKYLKDNGIFDLMMGKV